MEGAFDTVKQTLHRKCEHDFNDGDEKESAKIDELGMDFLVRSGSFEI